MARTKVRLSSRGIQNLLRSAGVRRDLTRRADRVLLQARATAPEDTGAYRASLHIEQATTDRAVVRVASDLHYAAGVEAHTGTLARALDAAGGR